MKKFNIEINKGNYNIETPERIEKFEFNRAYGWKAEYKKYRENWIRCPKEKILLDYPLNVDLELSSICNLKCPMCETTSEEYNKKIKKQFMEFSLVRKIIDEIRENVPAVRFALRGEATLHPQFIECIRYAKEAGIGDVSVVTNGSKLTPEFFEKMLLAGIDWITISIDGLKENYEKVRYPLKFEDTLQKIKEIKRIKEKYHARRPVIKIQSVWPFVKDDIEEYYNLFAPYVDLIAYNPLIIDESDESKFELDDDFSCSGFYQRLGVTADGRVLICSCGSEYDMYIGDVHHQSIHEIWHGKELTELREKHKVYGGFKDIDICRKCRSACKMKNSEVVTINGRKITIRDYIYNKG